MEFRLLQIGQKLRVIRLETLVCGRIRFFPCRSPCRVLNATGEWEGS